MGLGIADAAGEGVSRLSDDLSAGGHATSPFNASDPVADSSLERLVPLIYDELRVMAHRQLAREAPAYTLQTTELVHEAYVRLADSSQIAAHGRAYFFAAAATAMRRVLVDRARRRSAAKRGAGQSPLSLDEADAGVDEFAAELVALDDALERFAKLHPRQAKVVECRYFAGLDVEETAAALGISPRSVKYDWAMARAWLYNALAVY